MIHKNVVEKLFPEPLRKNQIWAYLQIDCFKFYTVCFYGIPSWGLLKHIETKLQMALLLRHINLFQINKKKSGTSLPISFSSWFLNKNIYLILFCYMIKFHCLAAFYLWDIWQYVYCNCLLTRLWRHRFWN